MNLANFLSHCFNCNFLFDLALSDLELNLFIALDNLFIALLCFLKTWKRLPACKESSLEGVTSGKVSLGSIAIELNSTGWGL
jgi:hypothetical protein